MSVYAELELADLANFLCCWLSMDFFNYGSIVVILIVLVVNWCDTKVNLMSVASLYDAVGPYTSWSRVQGEK